MFLETRDKIICLADIKTGGLEAFKNVDEVHNIYRRKQTYNFGGAEEIRTPDPHVVPRRMRARDGASREQRDF